MASVSCERSLLGISALAVDDRLVFVPCDTSLVDEEANEYAEDEGTRANADDGASRKTSWRHEGAWANWVRDNLVDCFHWVSLFQSFEIHLLIVVLTLVCIIVRSHINRVVVPKWGA